MARYLRRVRAWKNWATSARLKTTGRVCARRGKGRCSTVQAFPRVVRYRNRRAQTLRWKRLPEMRRSTRKTW
jgi:hypothetical protein